MANLRRSSKKMAGQLGFACQPAGFSVVELLITIVLAALVYAVALPAIGRARIAASMHNSRHAVVSSISLARATAIRYGRPAVLRLDSNANSLWIEADTSFAGSGAALDTIGFFALGQQYGVNMKSNRTQICFDGRGIGATSAACPIAGALILLALRDRVDTVLVTPTGRVFAK